MEGSKRGIIEEYVLQMCDNGWADEEATTGTGKAFLFRANLVDDHLASFFGLSGDDVSALAEACGVIASTGTDSAVELFRDATSLENRWKELVR